MKLYLIVMLSIILVGCTKKRGAMDDKNTILKDDTSTAPKVSPPEPRRYLAPSLVSLFDKLEKKEPVTYNDFLTICDFINTNTDESLSEGFGNTIFEYFKNNKSQNKVLLVFLNKKGEKYKDDYLHMLIKAMCIDIQSNEYTYDRLIAEFEIFRNNERVKKSFKDCMASDIQ